MNDLQTEADRRAQQSIVGNLTKMFPKMKIIGEEELPQPESMEFIKESDLLQLNCPDELSNIKEEDVIENSPIFFSS